jgi:stage V sporulation protein S
MKTQDDNIIRVSANSNANKLAGSISYALQELGKAHLVSIGADANNQSLKAIIIARGYITPMGFDLEITPYFQDIETEQGVKTSIHMKIKRKGIE